ncbi:transposase [Streptomyces sp. DR3-1]|nr:transposase [Streptomyces sp. DR3-1]
MNLPPATTITDVQELQPRIAVLPVSLFEQNGKHPQRTGVQWRYLSHNFPHWNTGYGYFAKWAAKGLLAQLSGMLSPTAKPISG